MRGCTGEINPNYGQTSLFLSTFKKTFPFTSIFLTIQVSYTFTYALSYRRQKLSLTETKAEHRAKSETTGCLFGLKNWTQLRIL